MTELDRLSLSTFSSKIAASPILLNDFENTTLLSVKHDLGSIPEKEWQPLDSHGRFPKDKHLKEGESIGIGRCVGTVQTTPERLLGWVYNVESDYDKSKHLLANGPNAELYPSLSVCHHNDHHQIYYSCRKMPFPLVARDFLQRIIYKRLDGDEGFMLV